MSLLLFLILPFYVEAFLGSRVRETLYFNDKNVSDKLLLTPYIKSGRIEEARKLAEVPSLVGNVKSYSGYLTVDESCDSNMFFWFFPAARKMESSPVLVWLQGGPGASSLYGLFIENGPYELTSDNNLRLRKFSWHEMSSIIYIDNPVGTGFSYTSSLRCYSRNETHIGQNLLSVVRQIMLLFPDVNDNPFYVTGESYAGKYVPALAYAIHKHNQIAQDKINLQGLAIGNGLVNPGDQLYYSDYLYQIGLLDTFGWKLFSTMETKCRKQIAEEKWMDAFDCFDLLLNGDKLDGKTYFFNMTGFSFYFNYLFNNQPPEGKVDELIKKPEIREAIHVGNSAWNNNSFVEDNLKEDIMKSVAPWLEELLEYYRVLIYNGQLDIIVAYPLTEAYLKKLQWSAADKYKMAHRHQWRVGSELAGYAKTAGFLTEVLVRNAGHMVPADQPKWAFDLISRFIHNKSFF